MLIASLELEGRKAEAHIAIDGLHDHCHIDEVADQLGGVFTSYSHGTERQLAWLRFGRWSKILMSGSELEIAKSDNMTNFPDAVQHFARAWALTAHRKQP